MSEYRWYYGLGEHPETYERSFTTRSEAVTAAIEDARGTYDKVTIVEGRPGTIDPEIFNADNVIEDLHEHNQEISDENGDLGIEPTREQRTDLEQRLATALAQWLWHHKLGAVTAISDFRHELVMDVPR